jgi:hypothetical protein
MNDKPDDLLIRFLLDELSEEERAEVEERFLSDNDFFEEVLSAEDSLMDQYLLGQLSADRRKRAETLFRSSHKQRREVEFTEGLIASLRETETEGRQPAEPTDRGNVEETGISIHPETETSRGALPWIPAGLRGQRLRLAWLAVLLLCFSLLAWIFYRYSQKQGLGKEDMTAGRNQQEVDHEHSEENRSEGGSKQLPTEKGKQEKTEELIAKAPTPKPNRTTSIVLAPAVPERGGGPQTPVLKIQGQQVRLQLALDKNWRYRSYDVLMTTFEGRQVWSKESVSAGQAKEGRLTFLLPSSLLQPEDYRIDLKGRSETGALIHIADYIFKVRK